MEILLNIGYVLMFIALAVKDILLLRVILSSAHLIIIGYSLVVGNYIIAFWNLIFILINIYQIVLIMKDRNPIKLSADIYEIYKNYFSIMTKKEFYQFWRLGDVQLVESGYTIIRKNDNLNQLMFVISGEASVKKNFKEIAVLHNANFMAEMSLISKEPASASVIAVSALTYICWNHPRISHLEHESPELCSKILATMGNDLVEKVKRASH